MGLTDPARAAIEAVFREEHGLVLAALIRYTGDIQLAEDSLQDACVTALGAWERAIPDQPAAWLTTAAKRKAIDRVRRARTLEAKYERIANDLIDVEEEAMEREAIEDDRLRLIFTCCHPAIGPDARVALTLRTVCGLTTPEIASAFLTSEATMAQRIVRAKRKIADAGIPYRVPDLTELPQRLDGVLSVIYLIFNEGYSASSGDELIRSSLTAEAIRLCTIVDRLLPNRPEVLGLLALMHLHDARTPARRDRVGDPILLPDQDRTRWRHEEIADGLLLLDRALDLGEPGPYQIQAAIAALHDLATHGEDTDWDQIVVLYGSLRGFLDTPTVRLNEAVAIAMAGDRTEALRRIDDLGDLDRYPYLHAARASLLADEGDLDGAESAYLQAIDLTASAPERRLLMRKLAALRDGEGG